MFRLFKLSCFCAAIISNPLFALSPAFSIQQGVLVYGSSSVKKTPDGGASSTEKESGFQTMPISLLIFATMEKLAFYVYPIKPGTPFAAGYYVKENLELGLNLALNSSNLNPDPYAASSNGAQKSESTNNSFGPYLTYYHSIQKTQLEFYYSATFNQSKSKTTAKNSGATTAESDVSGFSNYISLLALFPLDKNLFYGAGFDFTMDTKKDSKAKDKENSTGFNLNLASLRLNF